MRAKIDLMAKERASERGPAATASRLKEASGVECLPSLAEGFAYDEPPPTPLPEKTSGASASAFDAMLQEDTAALDKAGRHLVKAPM